METPTTVATDTAAVETPQGKAVMSLVPDVEQTILTPRSLLLLLICLGFLPACSGQTGSQGPQGPAGDPGPVGPQGPSGSISGPINGNQLIDGSVARGKLSRESVLPENRGRGNSVRSFTASFSGSGDITLYAVPSAKVFIVTDVVAFVRQQSAAPEYVTILAGSLQRAFIPTIGTFSPAPGSSPIAGAIPATSFQAGIRFEAGENVVVRASAFPTWVTISGYEF
jgi:hypothetical protein